MSDPSLFDYDPDEHARRSDPQTSHIAAANLTTMNSHCTSMLRAYAQHQLLGLTAEEAGKIARLDGAAPTSKRNSDLIRMGFIEPVVNTDGSNVTRTNSSNRPARVCTITLAGRLKLAELRRERADEA